jgi:alkanesulfonate monooxygenase SsuD/methylene tetrahydromethanopterin reductase-like flavin-dependent oxidoreductase (luciferase family)
MDFGVFDHLDRNALALPRHYEERLKLVEQYDQLGFYGYHVAEHHSTPLGMAPSPGIYLASAIQRTKRLRIGPLVYLLPLYHPLRLIEEVCMLDNLSEGRFQVGVGRGISPIELGYYNRTPEEAMEVFEENLTILLSGLAGETLSHDGRHSRFTNVPMSLRPVQQPHPPVWLGISSVESAERAARSRFNIVGLMPAAAMRSRVEAYRAAYPSTDLGGAKVGLSYLIVVGEDGAAAALEAEQAYQRWHTSFHYLYRLHGREPMLGAWPATFSELAAQERAVAGTPDTVADFICRQVELSGINYVVAQLMFGNLPHDSACRSVRLFASEVMPRVRKQIERQDSAIKPKVAAR